MKKPALFCSLIGLSVLSSLNNSSVLVTHSSSMTIQNSSPGDTIQYPEEKHLRNVQQLTFGGDNAEAYFSFDGKWIIFQRTQPKEGLKCDQMFIGKVPKYGEKFSYKMISDGKGRCTFGSITKDGK